MSEIPGAYHRKLQSSLVARVYARRKMGPLCDEYLAEGRIDRGSMD